MALFRNVKGTLAAILFLAACSEDSAAIDNAFDAPYPPGRLPGAYDAPSKVPTAPLCPNRDLPKIPVEPPPIFGEPRQLVTLPGVGTLQQDETSLYTTVYDYRLSEDRSLVRISKDAGEVALLLENPNFSLRWSLLDDFLYYTVEEPTKFLWGSLRRLPTSGGDEQVLREDLIETFVVDAEHVFYVSRNGPLGDSFLRRAPLAGGDATIVAENLPEFRWGWRVIFGEADRLHAIGTTLVSYSKATGAIELAVDLSALMGLGSLVLNASAEDEHYLYLGLSDYDVRAIGWLVRIDKCSGELVVLAASDLAIHAIALDEGNIYYTEHFDEHCDCADGEGDYDPPPSAISVWRQPKAGGPRVLLWSTWSYYMSLAVDDRGLYATDRETGLWFLPRLDRDRSQPNPL